MDSPLAERRACDSARFAANSSIGARRKIAPVSRGASRTLARRIFERMTSYATFRIAATVRVLLFMTLSILVFDFYPVTAVMIVLLAILNDGAILTIAYDRAESATRPEAWNMPLVLGIATVLGIAGVFASFGLFYAAERVFFLSQEATRTLMYLKLSVAGHLTIFVARTRKRFWQDKPAPVLVGAVVATQAVATLMAVYGVLMAPIGWAWAGFVWVYALAWTVINDEAKILAYRVFDAHEGGLLRVRTGTGLFRHLWSSVVR
jgi:H+-transporting ATPase